MVAIGYSCRGDAVGKKTYLDTVKAQRFTSHRVYCDTARELLVGARGLQSMSSSAEKDVAGQGPGKKGGGKGEGGGNSPRARYPLRVDVAKPAVMYQPSFGVAKPSPAKPAEAPSSSSSGGGTNPTERILRKRRRSGKTEYLVKRPGKGDATWEPAKSLSAAAIHEFDAKRQSREQLQNRLDSVKPTKQPADEAPLDRKPHRILAQRRFEGGQRYLIHWIGMSVTKASWESAKRLNNPTLVQDFENAVLHRTPRTQPCAFALRSLRGAAMRVCLCDARLSAAWRYSSAPPAHLLHRHDARLQVKRARATTESQLRSGKYSLASLGFVNAHSFQGPSSRCEQPPSSPQCLFSSGLQGGFPCTNPQPTNCFRPRDARMACARGARAWRACGSCRP